MSDDLVTIATFLNIGEAKLAQGKLSSSGIDASVRDENAMNLHIGMAMWGIKLQVPDHQVVRALEVLDDFPRSGRRRRWGRRCAVLPGVRVAGNPPGCRRQSPANHALVGGHPISRGVRGAKPALALFGLRVPMGRG